MILLFLASQFCFCSQVTGSGDPLQDGITKIEALAQSAIGMLDSAALQIYKSAQENSKRDFENSSEGSTDRINAHIEEALRQVDDSQESEEVKALTRQQIEGMKAQFEQANESKVAAAQQEIERRIENHKQKLERFKQEITRIKEHYQGEMRRNPQDVNQFLEQARSAFAKTAQEFDHSF